MSAPKKNNILLAALAVAGLFLGTSNASANAINAYGTSPTITFGTGTTSATITEKMRITSGGLIGVGLTNPSYTLDVSGSIQASTRVYSPVILARNSSVTVAMSPYSTTGIGYLEAFQTADNNQKVPLVLNRWGASAGVGIGGIDTPSTTLQVGGSLRISSEFSSTLQVCDTNRAGTIKYESGTFSTCNGTAWSALGSGGGGASPTNVPAFRAHKNGTNQSLTTSTYTDLTWSAKEFDTYSNFNTATGRFTPTVAGYYYLHITVGCTGLSSNNACVSRIMKNGTNIAQQVLRGPTSNGDSNVNTVVVTYLNGSTDYVSAQAYSEAATAVIAGSSAYTYFEGSLLASGNGLISGTGAGVSAMSSLTDVTLSSPTSNSILVYDGTKWVNKFLQDTVSTTTMVSGWPDAILCNRGSDSTARILYLTFPAYALDGKYYYRPVESNDTNMYGINFTAAGAYSSTDSGVTYPNCQKSITQLYASGQAFNFIGGSDANGIKDRIISGTTGMYAYADSSASIATAGTERVVVGTAGGVGIGSQPAANTGLTVSGTTYLMNRVGIGIGTSVPSGTLQVFANGGSASIVLSRSTGINTQGVWDYNSSTMRFGTLQTDHLGLITSNTTRLYISSAGLVGISTTAPQTALDISGTLRISDGGESCTSTTAGAIKYVSGTFSTCNGTAWSALGSGGTASPTNVPSFRVHKNGTNQTITASAWAKLTFSTKVFDTLNNFDTTNSRFTPTVAGNYLFTGSTYCNATSACWVSVYKNGVIQSQNGNNVTGSSGLPTTSVILPMNGTTDYVELYVFSSSTTIAGNPEYTQFQGSLLASGNGTISGTGAGVSAMSSLTDVTLSSPVSNSILVYDGTKWVNKFLQDTVSTTTMVPGWPDAISCSGSNGTATLYHKYGSTANSHVYSPGWSALSGGNADLVINFNASQTIATIANNGSVWTGYYESNCPVGTTISQLYASGRAFNFIGGSGTVSTSSADRITSGTTAAVITNDPAGTVSFTLGGTAGAAYMHPTLGLVTKGVSASNTVSASNLYGVSATLGDFSYIPSPLTPIAASRRFTNSGSSGYVATNDITTYARPSSSSSMKYYGTISGLIIDSSASTMNGWNSATTSEVYNNSTGTVNAISGAAGYAENNDGTIGYVAGGDNTIYIYGGFVSNTARATYSNASVYSGAKVKNNVGLSTGSDVYGGAVSNTYGIWAWNESEGGSTVNQYGLYLWNARSGGTVTNSYGIFQDSGINSTVNVFYSKTGFNKSNPQTAVDINGTLRVGDGGESCTGSTAGAIKYAGGTFYTCSGSSWTAFGSGGGGSADQITSGTLTVTANSSTGIVSLTTNGTTWGYLGSSGSYVPNLSSNAASATTVTTTAVQLASSTVITCDSTTAGTLRYISATTTIQLCTGSGWQPMGVGIPAGTISAFASTTCPTGWSEYTPARGRFLRGIDNAAGNDPSGTRAPGAVQDDLFKSHTHSTYMAAWQTGASGSAQWVGQSTQGATAATGGAETRPKNVAVTFCQFNGTSNGWNNPLSGGATVPGGNTGQIQYNTSGSFDGNAGLTWNNAAQLLTATNVSTSNISVSTINGVAVSSLGGATDRITSGSTNVIASNSDAVTVSATSLNVTGEARILDGTDYTLYITGDNWRTKIYGSNASINTPNIGLQGYFNEGRVLINGGVMDGGNSPAATFSVSGTTALSSYTTIGSDITPTTLETYGLISATSLKVNGVAITGGASGATTFASLTDVSTSITGGNVYGPGSLAGAVAGSTKNTAYGQGALASAANASSDNVAVGYNALNVATSGISNIAVGSEALFSNTSGNSNVAIGRRALYSVIGGGYNIALGTQAALSLTSGLQNTSIGFNSMQQNDTGYANVVLGHQAGQGSFGASHYNSSVIIGASSGLALTTGNASVLVGTYSGAALTSGTSNTLIGYNAGAGITTGGNNLVLGAQTTPFSNTGSNQLNIANAIWGNIGSGSGNNNLIGINVTSPTAALDISGTLKVNGVAITGGGASTFASLTDVSTSTTAGNVFGPGTLTGAKTGVTYATAIGINALSSASNSGAGSTAFGNYALNANTSGQYNVGMGYSALRTNTTASNNTAVGTFALQNIAYSNNTAVGKGALQNAANATDNTAIGVDAMGFSAATGGYNVTIGSSAAYRLLSGSNNIAIGANTGYGASSASYTGNVLLGKDTGYVLSNGSYNVMMGLQVGRLTTTGSSNTLIGSNVGYNITTGANNTLIGANVGAGITTGSNNVMLGYNISPYSNTGSNQLNIAGAIYGNIGSGLGLTNLIGINVTSPTVELDVSGSIQYSGSISDVSDRRAKTNIEVLPFVSAVQILSQLTPVQFEMKNAPGIKEYGFIAQDVEKVLPQLVNTLNDPSQTKTLNYVGLIPVLVKGTQELAAENAKLKEENAMLKATQESILKRLDALEQKR